MMALAAVVLSFAGFAALAVSMARHHRDLFGRPPERRLMLALRAAGWLLLAAAFAPAIRHSGPAIGIVLWFGIATLTAMSVALMLTYRSWWWRA